MARELTLLLIEAGVPAVTEHVAALEIVARCRCGDSFCASFYTQPKPNGAYGEGHRSIALSLAEVWPIPDIVADRIMFVEVLFRNEIREALDLAFP